MQTISIVPVQEGWALRSTTFMNEQFFRSGASAEAAAIRLAHGVADAGHDVEIEIILRDGSLGRRLVIPALKRPWASDDLLRALPA